MNWGPNPAYLGPHLEAEDRLTGGLVAKPPRRDQKGTPWGFVGYRGCYPIEGAIGKLYLDQGET